MFEQVKEDVMRYFTPKELAEGVSSGRMLKKILKNEGLWAVLLFRFGRWVIHDYHVVGIKSILKIMYVLIARPLEIVLGVNIHSDAQIGKGLYIGHIGGIWIGPVKMGDYCNLSQEVTIGIGGQGEFRGIPEIGSRVFFGPGAKVFGKIQIGDNVAIGANTVVSKSIPDNAVVLGNPGRIVGYGGSGELIDLMDEQV